MDNVTAGRAKTQMRTVVFAVAAAAAVVALAGLVYLPIWVHRHDSPPASVTTPPREVILAEVPDATLVGRHAGHKVWAIHAERVLASADGITTTFVHVDRGTLYRNGRAAARLSAGRAVYDDHRKTLEAEGVRLGAEGMTLTAERMRWSASSGAVFSPSVELAWEGGLAAAREMKADTTLSTVVARDVTMAARLEGPMYEKIVKRFGAATGASLALLLAAPTVARETPVRYREVRVRGDAWRYNQASQTHVYTGHVVVTHGDTTLEADRIAYNEAANTATVLGRIRVENPRHRMEGDSATVDFNAHAIVLRGEKRVNIVALPGPDAPKHGLRSRINEPVTMECRAITYNYRTRNADAEGPLTATRGGQVITGDAATWSAADEVMTIRGNVRGRDEKNQTFDAPSVRVSLAEGAEWMEASDVRATFFVKETDDEPVPAPTR